MTEVQSQVSFDILAGDDELGLDRLTTELEAELSEVGEVSRLVGEPKLGAKGDVEPAVLNVRTGVDPEQIEALVRVLTGFARRHKDRGVYVQLDGYEIKLDHASAEQVDDLIATFQSAVHRHES
ncbi:hypothetical protein [Kribbella sp. NPDC023855]|uniref:hypothetical protein n=1 Tax=Kribbella sp. NPDC023855 TaxID=3154698 RepID=UPI0033F7FD22